MSINYIVGELLNDTRTVQAFAQGCNVEGIMNSHTSIMFRNRYPAMYQEYLELCEREDPEFTLGDVFLWQSPRDGIWVFNLAIEENSFCKVASNKVLEKSFQQMRALAEQENITSIAMPTVGGGVGGLNWGRASKLLERTFRKWKGDIFVYVKQPSNTGAGR